LFDNGLPFQGDWKDIYNFTFDDYDWILPNGYVYKNILIESRNPLPDYLGDLGGNTDGAFRYEPPELSADGTILTIAPRPDGLGLDSGLWRNQITVTLNRDIKDTRGISLGRSTSFVIETEVDDLSVLRDYATNDPPYPQVLSYSSALAKASFPPVNPAYPDGRMVPKENIFNYGENGISEPSSNFSHHFAYNRDDNWVYIAFQTELMDYTFAGALVYEYYFDESKPGYMGNYTGEIASPVHNPVIVKPLTDALEKTDPSRPVRVVKYRLHERSGSGNLQVHLAIIPLDILDDPVDTSQIDGPDQSGGIFVDGNPALFNNDGPANRTGGVEAWVWFTETAQ
jgi:hypothetical protein